MKWIILVALSLFFVFIILIFKKKSAKNPLQNPQKATLKNDKELCDILDRVRSRINPKQTDISTGRKSKEMESDE